MKLKIFTQKVGGKYCPSFSFGIQSFHLKGFDTKEESEYMEQQLKVLFSNYALMIARKNTDNLISNSFDKLHEIMDEIKEKTNE